MSRAYDLFAQLRWKTETTTKGQMTLAWNNFISNSSAF